MADKHVADGESGFMAINSTPDACRVGNAVVPFDCFQYLSSKKQYAITVKARGFSVLNVGSVIAGTKSNAGSGVVSGTSLGSGDCIILTGSPTVRVEGKPIARHDSSVGMNNQNCLGKLQTLVAPPIVVVKDNTLPCNQSNVSSPWLERLKEAKKRADEDNGFGEEIQQADEWTAKQIDKLRPAPMPGKPGDMIYDYESGGEIPIEVYNAKNEINAGILRGVLGTVRSTISGIASLVNDVPQLPDNIALSSMILAENIRLGNICLESMKKDAEDAWEAAKELPDIAEKVWDSLQEQWDKASPGDKAELVSRGLSELAANFIPSNWFSKAGKVTKTGEIIEATSTVNKTRKAGTIEYKVDDVKHSSADKGRNDRKDDNNAKKNAEDVAKKDNEQSGVKIKRPNPTKIKCFSPFSNENFKKLSEADKKKYLKEYDKQLRGQQDAINNLSAEEFMAARQSYIDHGRNPLAVDAQDKFRAATAQDIRTSIYKRLRKDGVSPEVAEAKAAGRTKEIMEKLVALHEPDMVAGGWASPNPTRIGGSSVNGAIGGSWNHNKRLKDLETAARNSIASGDGHAKMNVILEVCRGKKYAR
ncbi:TPA: DUF4150 domain-containing protein [Escherichia coli]|nr:DUF4150 domain-containing protein [Escherichia coli]